MNFPNVTIYSPHLKIIPYISDNFKIVTTDLGLTPDKVVVSAANCYGYMDGGADLALMKLIPGVQEEVKGKIKSECKGINSIANPLIIKCDGYTIISVPTMPTHRIKVPLGVIYTAYLNLFITLFKEDFDSVSMPLFGCGFGGHNIYKSLEVLKQAYEDAKKSVVWLK